MEAELQAKLAEMHAQEQARRLNKGFQQSTRAHNSRVADTGGASTTKMTTGVLRQTLKGTGTAASPTLPTPGTSKVCRAGTVNIEKQFKHNWDALG